ncbi:MAG TPA: LysM peptidoglycan-binding domain-containing protein [Candidatus Sulfopaludibacter sp.]|nr:LysM peptidoglycan-binding domain-containing protein [Candidatus Sulfopaludibacter sp.]
MNSPNPFVPQGSLLELQSKRRSRLKVVVFCVLAVNVVGLMALLMQGCKREQTEAENQPTIDTNETAMMNTNPPPVEASNPPVQPPPAVTPAVAPETAGTEYVVVKGDSLWKIAKKNGVTVKAIEAANPGIDPGKLKVGQKLSIPGATSAAESATDTTAASGSGGGEEIYIVKSGDTLSKIAKRNGTTVRAIESENGLSTTHIKVGQKLKIPAKADMAPAAAPAPAPSTAPVTAPPAAGATPASDSTTPGAQ